MIEEEMEPEIKVVLITSIERLENKRNQSKNNNSNKKEIRKCLHTLMMMVH
jgi:hypothetical protein